MPDYNLVVVDLVEPSFCITHSTHHFCKKSRTALLKLKADSGAAANGLISREQTVGRISGDANGMTAEEGELIEAQFNVRRQSFCGCCCLDASVLFALTTVCF